MFRLHDMPALDPRTRLVNVVVDTPKGSHNKYKYDEDLGAFRLSRMMPTGMQFPYDFGSVPRTCAPDGDALDVLVVADAPTFTGCILNVRLLGALGGVQKQEGKQIRNDRLIGVPQTSVNRSAARDLRDLDTSVLKELQHFFVAYNQAQGRDFKITGRMGAAAAQALLKRSMRSFEKQHTAAR